MTNTPQGTDPARRDDDQGGRADEDGPPTRSAGSLTGAYRPGELQELRDEWDDERRDR